MAESLRPASDESGVSPLAVMLEAMRLFHRLALEALQAKEEVTAIQRLEAAAKLAQFAAPYIHSRLATITPPSDDAVATKIEMSELEIGRRLAFVLGLAVQET